MSAHTNATVPTFLLSYITGASTGGLDKTTGGQQFHLFDLKGRPGDLGLVSPLECASLPHSLIVLALMRTHFHFQKLLQQGECRRTG